MLRSRVIPCLLVHQNGLVKTVQFKDPKYVGDPLNAVKIFNEKEVDELMVIDIDASVEGRDPDFKLIENLAKECRMPLCYGGGVKTVEHAKRIVQLGAEKIAVSSILFSNFNIINNIAEEIGMQSIVAVLDVKKKGLLGGYEVYTHNGKKNTGIKLKDIIQQLEKNGIGEIVINNIDRDGTMKGYDLDLIELVRKNCTVPLTCLGGVGEVEHIKKLIEKYKVIGASAGSLFVFKGKYKAVLINYPSVK